MTPLGDRRLKPSTRHPICMYAAHRSRTLAFGKRRHLRRSTQGALNRWRRGAEQVLIASFRVGFTMATRSRSIVGPDEPRRRDPLAPLRRRGALVLARAGECRRVARGERLCRRASRGNAWLVG